MAESRMDVSFVIWGAFWITILGMNIGDSIRSDSVDQVQDSSN